MTLPGEAPPEPAEVLAATVREAYGKLVAYLGARWRDLAAVEDALADAIAAALRDWPASGIPDRPEAWLQAAAHRRLIDGHRHRQVRQRLQPDLAQLTADALVPGSEPTTLPDERLPLLFVCAHPAIAPDVRTPLMLQLVLGHEAERIAGLFLTSPAAMSQRLVRAKQRIRDTGIAFRIPDPEEWPARVTAVLEAIYAAFALAVDDPTGVQLPADSGRQDALRLARIVVQQLPEEAEALGLLALLLYVESRRDAARDAAGEFVPLDQQDPARWNHDRIAEAEQLLRRASIHRQSGRYQLEAALQSVHAARAHTGTTDGPALLALYDRLLACAPTLGAQLGRIAALLRIGRLDDAWNDLAALSTEAVATHAPYWVLRSELLHRRGDQPAADQARQRAIGLTIDPAVRRFLARNDRDQ